MIFVLRIRVDNEILTFKYLKQYLESLHCNPYLDMNVQL